MIEADAGDDSDFPPLFFGGFHETAQRGAVRPPADGAGVGFFAAGERGGRRRRIGDEVVERRGGGHADCRKSGGDLFPGGMSRQGELWNSHAVPDEEKDVTGGAGSGGEEAVPGGQQQCQQQRSAPELADQVFHWSPFVGSGGDAFPVAAGSADLHGGKFEILDFESTRIDPDAVDVFSRDDHFAE